MQEMQALQLEEDQRKAAAIERKPHVKVHSTGMLVQEPFLVFQC
jgi:hypothetical protein